MVNVECPRCGWKWNTESLMWKVNCPSCGKKVKNPEAEKK